MRLIDKDRLLKGTNHYLMRLDEDSIALGDIESIDVRFVEMAEEVKAIPIEWMKNYARKICTDDDGRYNSKAYGIDRMIYDWEKENDE